MRKSPAQLIEVTKAQGPADVLESILSEARALAPGSDVEGFMEQRLLELTRSARGAVVKARAEDQAAASQEADFSPSALPSLRGGDEARSDGAPSDRDPLGPGGV